MSKSKSTFMSCAGTIEVCTAEQFIEQLCEKSKSDIADKIADVEILGLEDDGKPPVVRQVYVDYSHGSAFFSEDEYGMSAEWKSEKIKLVPIKGDYKKALKEQLEKILVFEDSTYIQSVENDPMAFAEVIEDMAIKSLEYFGMPTHFIDFGDGKHAIVAIDDMSIKSCVYNREVRAGIIMEKVASFGIQLVKEKDMN